MPGTTKGPEAPVTATHMSDMDVEDHMSEAEEPEPVVEPEPEAAAPEGEAPEEELAAEEDPEEEDPEEEELETEEPAAEPEEEETPDDGKFDSTAFAEKHGLDVGTFSKCKTPQQALDILARTHSFFTKTYGDHANELGEARRELAEARAQAAAGAEKVTSEQPAEKTDKAMTDEQLDH